MTREDLEAMTKDELREHAEVKGITLASMDTKGTMVDKIMGEYVEPAKPTAKRITVPEEKLSPLGKLHTIDGKPVNGRKFELFIYATESDKSPVDIIVNGHNIRVKRGVKVIVDEAYIGVLQTAVVDTVMQDPDSGVRSAQSVMTYPHTAVPV